MTRSPNPADTFLHEASELLEQVEAHALEIRPGCDCNESVNHLFRAFHTIKGSGSMFGFTEVAAFTHHVESALDLARSGALTISPELIALLLASRDHIAALLAAAQANAPADHTTGDAIVASLRALLPQDSPPSPEASPPAIRPSDTTGVESFRIRFRPAPDLLAAGTDPRLLLDELRALGDCEIVADTGAIPTLDRIQPDHCHLAWDIVLQTDKGENAVRDVFMFVEDGAELRIERAPASDPSALPSVPAPASIPPPTGAAPPLPSPALPVAKTRSAPIRVASERLDLLVNLVGELVMTQSRIAQIAGKSELANLDAPVEDLERIVGAMRDAVLGIRMMPIGATFARFKRLVHDLSNELGKEIDLRLEGEETELDKTVLDQLADPLVHLVRNSVDHGIEPPAERRAAGKPPRATLRISAAHQGAHVVVAISDDGRGFNLDAIRAKAVARGIIGSDTNLSEKETLNLVFLPGFSTAATVTNVSGRGVGMDVVRRQVDAIRGSIRLSHEPGRGSTVALHLPLTLAIIEGQLVEIGTDRFIVPMAAVAENVELEPGQRSRRNGRNVVAVRGELVPYVCLRDLFEIRGAPPTNEKIVIVNHDGARVGLVVDRVLGSHQTVIQSLGRFYRDIRVASGATIMGDGRVALILDLGGLVLESAHTAGDPAPRSTPDVATV